MIHSGASLFLFFWIPFLIFGHCGLPVIGTYGGMSPTVFRRLSFKWFFLHQEFPRQTMTWSRFNYSSRIFISITCNSKINVIRKGIWTNFCNLQSENIKLHFLYLQSDSPSPHLNLILITAIKATAVIVHGKSVPH